MKNSKYWEKRFVMLQKSMINRSTYQRNKMVKVYLDAIAKCEGDINYWYSRFAINNNISLADAKKWLTKNELKEFKWTLEEYTKYAKNNDLGLWTKELENASAKVHISRLQSLEMQLEANMQKVFNENQKNMYELLKNGYKEDYYHTAFEIAKGTNIGTSLMELDESLVERIISRPWAADGKTFSERLWLNQKQLVDYLKTDLTQSIIRGENPQELINRMTKKLSTSSANASRLVMTESAYFSSAAKKQCFKDLDVEEYQIIATLDTKTSEICQDMDLKVFPMSVYEEGKTAPPFHVNCRTTTAPYYDDMEIKRIYRDENGRTRDKDGNINYVDGKMSHKEWYEKFVLGRKE